MDCFTLLVGLVLLFGGFPVAFLGRLSYMVAKHSDDELAKLKAVKTIIIGLGMIAAGVVVLFLVFPNV
jgi:hypothetical protein